jgi:hypothetical protein
VKEPQSSSPQHRVGGRTDDVARVFYLNSTQTVQELQEMTTAIRSIGEIRRAFTYNHAKAVAMRANADQIALTEFLVDKLNRPAGKFNADKAEYRMIGEPEGVVRLFAINAPTAEAFQQRVKELRVATGARRAFTYNTHRALMLRGTPEQVLEAERLIEAHK